MKRRVVITGLGAVTPLGTGVERSWEALCQGKSGIGPITRFDAANFRTRIAGEVRDFEPADFMERKQIRRIDRFIQFALAAARMALDDSGVKIAGNPERVGVSIGSAVGGIEYVEKTHPLILRGAVHQVSPFFVPGFLVNMAAGYVAIQHGARGPHMCPVTACASANSAIGDAFKCIQRGEAEVMIAGGAEAGITPIMVAGFDALRATSPRNSEPEKASRPFEKNRDGFVSSEGAGILILEELEFALNRGARIYAEVLGCGSTNDAHHITAPDPKGIGAASCMSRALQDADLTVDEIDYINAHGTSTQLNDLTETRAIKSVFGKRSHKIAVSSNKSMIGHLWGASGAVEAVFSVLTITQGVIPPTINYETADPECDLDYVPNVARETEVRTVLSNSFGFGGVNVSLVFSWFKP